MNANKLRFSPERLREAREGISITQIAAAAEVTETTVRNWEAGRGEPDATPLGRIAQLTGKALDFFYVADAA